MSTSTKKKILKGTVLPHVTSKEIKHGKHSSCELKERNTKNSVRLQKVVSGRSTKKIRLNLNSIKQETN